jgi:hypothetical protein
VVTFEELASKEPSQGTAKMALTTTRMGSLIAPTPVVKRLRSATVVLAVSAEAPARMVPVAQQAPGVWEASLARAEVLAPVVLAAQQAPGVWEASLAQAEALAPVVRAAEAQWCP